MTEAIFRERLQAIIDWADLAMKNAAEFNSHGVRNLDGPVFDAAREELAKFPSPEKHMNGGGMTDAEINRWIEACNHEPAKDVLRGYLNFRAGIKRLSEEEELCGETMPEEDAFNLVRMAAKLAAAEARIEDLTTERDNLANIVASGIDEVAGAALDDAEETIARLSAPQTNVEGEPIAYLVKRYSNDSVLLDTELSFTKPTIRSTCKTEFVPLVPALATEGK